MKTIRTAIVMLAVVAAMILAPLCLQSGDAESSDGIVITLPGTESESAMDLSMGAGETRTFTFYIYNESSSYLTVTASGVPDSSAVDITVDLGEGLLSPHSTGGSDHIVAVNVTVSVDRYDKNLEESARIVLSFMDLSKERPSFERTVDVSLLVDSAFVSPDGNNKFLGMFPNTLDGALGSEWFTAVVTVVAWMLIALVVCIVFIPVFLGLFTRRDQIEGSGKLHKNLTTLVVLLIAVLALNQCLTILGAGPEVRDGFATLSGVLYVVISAVMAWTIYVFVITLLLKGMEKGTDSTFDSSLIPLFKMIGKIIIAVGSVAAILAIFGVDLTGILLSAGVVTLGITLGAQNILNQFFSGIVLLSTRPFKRGDFVQINGVVYIVRRVKLMFTEFDNWDKDQVVTIPNNIVSGGTIVNMTREDSEARAYVYMTVDHGTDLTKAQELMVQAAMEHPHVIKDGSRSGPSTRLTNVQESSVELRLAVYVDDFDSSGSYAGQLRARILQLFGENGIDIPYNKLDVFVNYPDGRRDGDAEDR